MSKVSGIQVKEYFDVMRKAMFDTNLKGVAPSLLWYLSINTYEKIFFTQANLAKLLGVERKAVMRATKSLEKNGYVDIDRPKRGSHKTQTISLKKQYRAPTKLIVSCPFEVHDMSVTGTGGDKKVVPVMSVSGTHNGINGNNLMVFPKKASVKSQEYLGDSASTETLDTPNSPAPANRLFSLPEALTHEQTVWLTGESNLPVENDFWTDDVFPPFRAHTLSTNRTFKTEENFLFGVLAYGLNMDKRKFINK